MRRRTRYQAQKESRSISPREKDLEDLLRRTEQMLMEARTTARGQMSKSVAWDESESLGIPSQAKRINNMSEREYKDTLCRAYINMPWIAACIDARILRLISGTWELAPTVDNPDQKAYDQIMGLLTYINDDEDLMQYLYSYGLDMMIYGEAYTEIVCGGKGKPSDIPTALHKVDCQTMTFDLDETGNVKTYKQILQHQKEPIVFEPDQIMRCWFPSPESNKKALSPIAKLVNTAMLYEQMMEWARNYFKKGARPPFSFEHPGDRRHAEEFLIWIKENFTGRQNAHVPLITFDGVKMVYAPPGPVDMDFLKGLEWCRQETMSSMQTPPANIAVIESGNLGSGSGFSQQTSFIHNAVRPLERFILEKFNYSIINKKFNTTHWKLVLHYASYMEEADLAKLEDMRIHNGTSTPNEARKAMDRNPYEKYGDIPAFVLGREVVPLDRLDLISSEQTQTVNLGIELQKVQLDKLKSAPSGEILALPSTTTPPSPSDVPQGISKEE